MSNCNHLEFHRHRYAIACIRGNVIDIIRRLSTSSTLSGTREDTHKAAMDLHSQLRDLFGAAWTPPAQ